MTENKLTRPSKSFPPGPQKWLALLSADPIFLIAWLFAAIAEGITKGIMKASWERKQSELDQKTAEKLAAEIEAQSQPFQNDTKRRKRPKG